MTDAAVVVAALRERGWTVAVAESLTGGLLAAELVAVPGASDVLTGGIVAYATPLKRDLVGVDAALLAREGPVHPEVARQLAERVRSAAAIDGRDADVGVGTTGVAGPGASGGHPAGEVHIAVATPRGTVARRLSLEGDRESVRRSAVAAALALLAEALDLGRAE
jgi:nicotinamide-nucleotide amidase